MAVNPLSQTGVGIPGGIGGGVLGLGVVLALHDQFSKQANLAKAQLAGLSAATDKYTMRMNRNLVQLQASLAGLAIGIATLAAVSFPVRSAIEFEQAIQRVRIVAGKDVPLADLETMAELTAMLGYPGMGTPEGIVGFAFSLVGIVLAVFAASQAVAIREEEATWRIEHLLVRPIGRVRWLATRTVTAAAAIAIAALSAGVLAWVGTALVGTPIAFTDGLLAGVNLIPIAWLALGVGIAVVGLAPRRTAPITYTVVVAAYLLDFVGGMLELPEAVLDLSPFRHLAAVPAADLNLTASLVMLAVAVAGAAVGILAFRHRDLQEA